MRNASLQHPLIHAHFGKFFSEAYVGDNSEYVYPKRNLKMFTAMGFSINIITKAIRNLKNNQGCPRFNFSETDTVPFFKTGTGMGMLKVRNF